MARSCGTDLGTRSDKLELPAATTPTLKYLSLLNTSAQEDTWRIVEAFSTSSLPFALSIAWSAGTGVGATALITVCRSARVAIYARSILLRAANLSTDPNTVGATIADGFAQTHNQWEERGAAQNLTAAIVSIPPFTLRFRVDLADASLLPSTQIMVYDGQNTLCATVMGDAQPDGGIPIGGARRIEILTTADVEYRVVFTLSL